MHKSEYCSFQSLKMQYLGCHSPNFATPKNKNKTILLLFNFSYA